MTVIENSIDNFSHECNTRKSLQVHARLVVFSAVLKETTISVERTSVSMTWNIRAQYKSPTVTSDNYWLALIAIRRKIVHIIKANVPSVACQFSHRCTVIHASGQLLHWWHAAAVRPRSSQAPLQISNIKCSRYAPAWLPMLNIQLVAGKDYSVATGLWCAAINCGVTFIWRCTVYRKNHC